MRVDLEMLRKSLNELIDHAIETSGPSIDIDADLFWFVPPEQLCDPTREPHELTIGSAEDDWREVNAIGRGTKLALGYGLVWASTILRLVGDRVD